MGTRARDSMTRIGVVGGAGSGDGRGESAVGDGSWESIFAETSFLLLLLLCVCATDRTWCSGARRTKKFAFSARDATLAHTQRRSFSLSFLLLIPTRLCRCCLPLFFFRRRCRCRCRRRCPSLLSRLCSLSLSLAPRESDLFARTQDPRDMSGEGEREGGRASERKKEREPVGVRYARRVCSVCLCHCIVRLSPLNCSRGPRERAQRKCIDRALARLGPSRGPCLRVRQQQASGGDSDLSCECACVCVSEGSPLDVTCDGRASGGHANALSSLHCIPAAAAAADGPLALD